MKLIATILRGFFSLNILRQSCAISLPSLGKGSIPWRVCVALGRGAVLAECVPLLLCISGGVACDAVAAFSRTSSVCGGQVRLGRALPLRPLHLLVLATLPIGDLCRQSVSSVDVTDFYESVYTNVF